jgi:hypothetical protein
MESGFLGSTAREVLESSSPFDIFGNQTGPRKNQNGRVKGQREAANSFCPSVWRKLA